MPILGHSPAIREVRERIAKAAPTNTTVLILGPTGSGKELVAQEIHQQSQRSSKRFVAVNCASIPSLLVESEFFGHIRGAFTGASFPRNGKFIVADGGTLFLDEIGDLDAHGQACLLRVIEERAVTPVGSNFAVRVDARLVCATNRDLMERVREGKFREDLYYRISVVRLRVPALREHAEDIPVLVRYALQRCRKLITPQAMEVLQRYHWPGNVRELFHVLEESAVLSSGEVIGVSDLPPLTTPVPSGPSLEDAEIRAVLQALVNTNGKTTEAARILGCSRKHVWELLKRNSNHVQQ